VTAKSPSAASKSPLASFSDAELKKMKEEILATAEQNEQVEPKEASKVKFKE